MSLELKMTLNTKEVSERQLSDNRRVFTTEPVEVFDSKTGGRSMEKLSLYKQIYNFYTGLKGRELDDDVEELCNTIESSTDTDEIIEALGKLRKKI